MAYSYGRGCSLIGNLRIMTNSMNKQIIAALKWLQGKKNILAGLITTTSAFLAAQGVITPELATYINALSLLIFGSASVATSKLTSMGAMRK